MKKNFRHAVAAVSAITIVAASSVPVSAAGFFSGSNNCNSNSAYGNCNVSIKGYCPDSSEINSILNSLLGKLFGNGSNCTSGNSCNVATPETENGSESDCSDNTCDTDNRVTAPETGHSKPDNTPTKPADPTSKPDIVTPDEADTDSDTATPDETASEPDTTVPDDTISESDTDTSAPSASDDSVSEYEKRVVELVNAERAKYGLSDLSLNTELSAVARAKSQDMRDNNYFSHTSPTYGSPFDMMKSFGIKYKTAGENIAMGYKTPEAVVEGWMNSAGHRANILNSSFKEIGVGYVADGNYWTQMFIG